MPARAPQIDNIVTPFGVAKYPKLNAPDTKFKEDGEYSVKIVLDPANAKQFIASVDELYDRVTAFFQAQRDEEIRQKGKDPSKARPIKKGAKPYREEADPDTGELSGLVEVTAKLPAIGRSKRTGKTWENRPVIIDSNKKVVNVEIGGGSTIRFSAQAYGWFTPQLGAGVTLRLKTVQVKELKTWGQDATEGFDAVDDGYVGQEASTTTAPVTSYTTAEAEGDTDFDF